MSLRNRKNEEFKQEIKAEKLMEFVAKQSKTTLKDYYINVGFKLIEEFGLLSHAFNEISVEGDKAIKDLKLPENFVKPLVEMIKEKIKPPEVQISALLNLQNNSNDGIELIKKILLSADEYAKKNKFKIKIVYISAPKYRVESYESDYKSAQENLQKVCDKIVKDAKASKGSCEITKKK